MSEQKTRTAVLIVSLTASFLTPFMVSSVNIALPTIGRDLSMNAVAMSWITTAYLLCSAIFLIPFGKIADTFGRKRIFFVGILIITISSLLSAIISNGLLLILTRMLHGAGAAMVFGTGMAMLTSVYPPQQRGRVLGINVSFTYLGLTLGPVIGGFLTHRFGWRSLFWVNIPIGIAVLAVVRTRIKQEWAEKEYGSFDGWGALLYGASITLVITGFTRLTHAYGMLLMAAGCAAGAVFIRLESRASRPILPIRLFRRNRVFACSNIAALINYSATYAVGFLMSLYLQYVKGFRPDKAGGLMIVQPIVMVLLSPLAGRLSDHIEPRIPASAGMGCITIGLILLTGLDAATPIVPILLTMMLFGCGFALFSSPNTSAVMGSVDRSNYGIASATVGTMRLLGQVFSMGFTLLLISIMIGEGKITPECYPQFLKMMHTASALFAGLSVVGVAVSLVRGDVRGGVQQSESH
ncbi:MAG: MFS transporter [Chitinispirillaceae bacterium]|nr:MFS transporter [Chitinispirillaceae bacterium]